LHKLGSDSKIVTPPAGSEIDEIAKVIQILQNGGKS